jgi:hypothetical protein
LTPPNEDGLRAARRRYMRHVNLREGWRAPRRLARYLWQGCFACRPMDEAYLLASNSIRCGRAWRGGAECHRS